MGRILTCDGTGVPIPDDTPTTGDLGRQYSDEARPIAQAYLDERDAIHTEHAEKFEAALEALRVKYRPQLAGLPDDAE